ncbi:hypothetical protein ASD64_16075 [Mesorhizobium sp. Root157]|uniref:DUF2059 domain-containing protein n=1 Tax=Mesorhizobium sp. Root157 TaxID=1736477 RepID=UPI0006F75C81|nr:DUF2059 domain-containing protein [Mesorhizobium sp. Root157]KQZ98484.1 hypothetical protein ASD64_16075 [Mesorhizobium sp. Root157]
MKSNNRIHRFAVALAAAAVVGFAMPSFAQEISESHLKAAKTAVAAIHATDSFDNILPQAAVALESSMIQKNPDLEELIGSTVSAQALALAPRRADLEKEAATAYAKVFSEQELNDIATFYSSEAGKKLLESGPIVSRELVKAAEIWQNGIARDLAQKVGESMQAAMGAKAPAVTPADAATPPVDGAAPAPSGN